MKPKDDVTQKKAMKKSNPSTPRKRSSTVVSVRQKAERNDDKTSINKAHNQLQKISQINKSPMPKDASSQLPKPQKALRNLLEHLHREYDKLDDDKTSTKVKNKKLQEIGELVDVWKHGPTVNTENAKINAKQNLSPILRTTQHLKLNKEKKKSASKSSIRNSITVCNVGANNHFSSNHSKISTKTLQNRDEFNALRNKVDQAIKHKRIFTVCGPYNSIRQALISRGWVEKLHIAYVPNGIDSGLYRHLQTLTIQELGIGLMSTDLGSIYRRIIMSKMIGNHPVAFFWDFTRQTYRQNADELKNPMVNFIGTNRFTFANKHGLCETAKFAYWYHNPGISLLLTPRSYCITNSGDPDEFVDDFKTTAALSFLKWIIDIHEHNVSKLISATGKIPVSSFHFALLQCSNLVRKLRHDDIDAEINSSTSKEWQTFLDLFYKAVHVGNHFKQCGLESELTLVHKSRAMLKKIADYFPYLTMDGFMNIWILKPAYGSRGIGIHFCRTLQNVLKVVKENTNVTYVIQKYIERPLLIYNTKFDIRQWFLISSTQPLTIWLYKECYLRFSSQTYNLRKLHESIHLTNNSVQYKYHNINRDICLPANNMWYLNEFKSYLDSIGHSDVFEKIIQPGMKECILAAILSNQDSVYRTSKAFELHGADFMLTEDFRPWLIEINSKPALHASTSVTSKLCPMVLEDTIKVVIDNAKNPAASTGNFELCYKETPSATIPNNVQNLILEGKPVASNYFLAPANLLTHMSVQSIDSVDSLNLITSTDYENYVGKDVKNTLRQLLQIIKDEKSRREESKSKAKGQSAESVSSYYHDVKRIHAHMEEIQDIYLATKDQLALNDKSDASLKTSSQFANYPKLRIEMKPASNPNCSEGTKPK